MIDDLKNPIELVRRLREIAGASTSVDERREQQFRAVVNAAAEYVEQHPPWIGQAERRWIARLGEIVRDLTWDVGAGRVALSSSPPQEFAQTEACKAKTNGVGT